MTAWLRQNWKYLLAAVAGFVIVVLLYLRQRSSSSSPAGVISFPPNPISDGAGSAAAPAAAPTAAPVTPALLGPLIPPDLSQWTWGGSGWFPRQENLPPGWAWGQTGAYWLGGGPAYGHFVWTGGGWLPNPTNPPADWIHGTAPAGTGVGGPGLIYQADVAGRLSTAALAAETGAHRAALANPRLSRRLSHDARQAARESRRVFVESRGAAPTRRQGGSRWAR